MDASDSKRQKRRDDILSFLDVAIEGTNLTKEILSLTPAKAVFGSVGVLLRMIRVCLPLSCNDGPRVHTYPGFYEQRHRLR